VNPISELHARIEAKKVLIGCSVESFSPSYAEMAGMLGFDLVWADLEHMSGSPHQVELFCIGAKAGGALPIIRVPFTERTHIMRPLEAGARLISIPMVETAEMSRKIVEYGKYKPAGNRGFATPSRGLSYGIGDPLANTEWANRETHLFPQIETMDALHRCKEIVGVAGISGGVIGPADLSFSMGKPLKFDDREMINAVSHAVREICSLNKIAIAVTAHPGLLKASFEAGARVFVCATERFSLRTHWQQTLGEIRAMAGVAS
jgi:2-keto-3-deoxy-L-rhamnonate aldolase RhmA